jgi:hypothetical protein
MPEYIVVEGSDLVKFGAAVNEYISEGWQCQGGVAVAVAAWSCDTRKGEETYFHTEYLQAMVR